jgi:hypothetical protein
MVISSDTHGDTCGTLPFGLLDNIKGDYFILLYVVAVPSGSSVNVISFSEMEILKCMDGIKPA